MYCGQTPAVASIGCGSKPPNLAGPGHNARAQMGKLVKMLDTVILLIVTSTP